MPRVPGPLGLLHPFPSTLDACAAAAIAWLAGGPVATVVWVGLAMGLLQTSIGATNDVCDIEHDRVARPEKPLPSGSAGRRGAAVYASAAALVGLAISFCLGPLAGTVAAAGLACGLVYDGWLNRTAWSWLPFALGLPLLPAFAWAAVRGRLPDGFLALLVLGAVAGAALALANGLADLEGDTSAGRGGLAYRLGRPRALRLLLFLHATLLVVAALVVATSGRPPLALGTLVLAVPIIAAGTIGSRAASAAAREYGWEAQALGVALLAVAWLAATEPRILG
jgi:4-hydroxybenzoate polyprenyltransferase